MTIRTVAGGSNKSSEKGEPRLVCQCVSCEELDGRLENVFNILS